MFKRGSMKKYKTGIGKMVRYAAGATVVANRFRAKGKKAPPKARVTRPVKKVVAPLKKRVKRLEKQIKGNTSVLTYKLDSAEAVKPAIAGALNGYRNVVYTADIESAIAQCRYFDPSNPGTLITGSLATPTYQQKIRIAVYTKTVIKNSYMVPCVVTYGVLTPKQATSITPTTAWTNGLADQGNPTNTSYLLGMSDSIQFKQLWSCMKWHSKQLMPGEQIVVIHNQPIFDYDPAYQDSESETYNRREKSAVVFYRVRGVLSHDTANAQIGIGQAGIDIHSRSTYKIYYNSGGASINTIVLSQGATSLFTNGAVTGMKDIPDNIAYSVA